MRLYRASEISMIPQGAMNSLNPVMPRQRSDRSTAWRTTTWPFQDRNSEERAWKPWKPWNWTGSVGKMYPHELSGGMKQRVCIAISIAMHPKVIIADEPTSALDVVTQRQVMQTIGRLQEELGSAVILIGHDMGLMAQFVDRMAVMYAGSLVELGTVSRTHSPSPCTPIHRC